MSTRNQMGLPEILAVIGIATVAGWIAATVLTYLQNIGTSTVDAWWIPVFIAIPIVLILGILAVVWLDDSR
jgi:hypothetical protein